MREGVLVSSLLGIALGGGDLSSRQLIIGRGVDLASNVGSLMNDVIGGVYTVKAYENEPVEISLQSGLRSLMDVRSLEGKWGRPSGFLNETGSLWVRPREKGDSVSLFVTDFQHQAEGNVTVVFDTVRGYDPRLYDLRSSVGYLEPKFSKDHYSYFLRVPEGASLGRLRLTAMDDKLTQCSVRDQNMQLIPDTHVVGEGVTGNVALLSAFNRFQGNVISVECVHPRDPANPVRYIVQAVEQKGGSTRLRTLDVTGGDLDQIFHPQDRGVYTVDLTRAQEQQHPPRVKNNGWVSFRLRPENPLANVTVEGIPVDPSTWNSPYFRIPIGETRLFHVGVKTPTNPVEEIYNIAVSRPTPGLNSWFNRFMNVFTTGVTAISSTRAYHLLHNFHVLQWISAISQSRGLDDKWYHDSAIFHKFNWGGSGQSGGAAGPERHLVKFSDSLGERRAAWYINDNNVPVPYISQDTPYGHPVDRWALKYLPNALVDLKAAGGVEPQWYNTLFNRDVLDLELDRQRRLDEVSDSESSRLKSSKVRRLMAFEEDNFDDCLNGEDRCFPRASRSASRRRLSELSPEELNHLIDGLEANYRESDLILRESRRLIVIMISLVAIGIAWYAALQIFMASHRINDLNKMYPRWLKPTRFWIFVLDLCYIAITQATFSILFSRLSADTDILVLGLFTVTARTFGFLGLVLWFAFGAGFVMWVGNAVSTSEDGLLFANIFSRWHDSEIKMIKAIYKPLAHLPLVGRLFDVEVCQVAPIVVRLDGPSLESKGTYTYTPIYLNEEPRDEAPWCTGHTAEAFRQYNRSTQGRYGAPPPPPSKFDEEGNPILNAQGVDQLSAKAMSESVALRDRHAMKYYIKSDETAVFLDLTDYHEGQYFNINAKAMHEFPDSDIGRFKKCVLNNYGQVVELQPTIQLKHLPCIGDSFEQSLMSQCIADRENLDMPLNDEISNAIAKCQKGNVHWWILERVAVISSIILATWLSSGVRDNSQAYTHSWTGSWNSWPMIIFTLFAAALLAVAIPSAISTSLSDFWYKMETDYYLSLKTHKYDRDTLAKFHAFPWNGNKANQRKYLQICDDNERLIESRYKVYSAYLMFQDLIDMIIDSDIWRSRTFLLIRAIAEHQALTEFLKGLLCLVLIGTGGLTASGVSFSPTVGMSICFLAILMINTESIKMFYYQVLDFLHESYFQIRTIYLTLVDCMASSAEFRDRLSFYVSRLGEALHANAVSFIYDGFQSESSHDLSLGTEILVVNNQMGTVMPGQIDSTKSNWRKILDEDNPLTRPCYSLQKTLHLANGIGVYRKELYRALPVEIPMINLCSENRVVTDNRLGKLVATIQIVNHNYIRYIPGVAHTHDDDSFLSFYTDPSLVPTNGVFKKQYLGHGMVASYDVSRRQFRIRGPGIEAGKTYNIKLVDKLPNVEIKAESDVNNGQPQTLENAFADCQSSDHVKDPLGETLTLCSSPGMLLCPVPTGYTPDLTKPIHISRGPTAESIVIDPVHEEVTWDGTNRILLLYHERFLVKRPHRSPRRPTPGSSVVSRTSSRVSDEDFGPEEYLVKWHVRPKPSAGRQNFESVVSENYGELLVPVPDAYEGPMYLSRSMFIRVRATDKTSCMDIYGADTNSYEFPLSASCKLPRGLPGDGLIEVEAKVKAEWDTWTQATKSALWAKTAEDRVPCTVIACVDPLTEDYRVEPDFKAAKMKAETRITLLKGLRNQVVSKHEIWRVWPHVMSLSEYAEFWRYHLDSRPFERGKQFIDPLQAPDHPQLAPLKAVIQQQITPAFMEYVISKINSHINALSYRVAYLNQWEVAYEETGEDSLHNLYYEWQKIRAEEIAHGAAVSHPPESAFQEHRSGASAEEAFNRFLAKRSLYQRTIDGFCYPMIVNKQFISQRGNWEAQFNQWSRQLHRWFVDEEVDADNRSSLFCETYYAVMTQFLTSLRQNIFKPEDLMRGRTATVLHYVTNSLAVRGPNFYWKPDPLGGMFGAVRIWRSAQTPSSVTHDAYWMSCHVKLTGNALKIYRADGLYDPIGVEHDWNRINGWRIPLDCFEKIELGLTPPSSDAASSNIHLKTLVGLLTFRKNGNGRVDDSYVETIQDRGVIDNRVALRQGDYVLQNGFDVSRNDLHRLDIANPDEINEHNEMYPGEANVYPLQIRLFPRDLIRWESVVRACHMNYRRTDELEKDYLDPNKIRVIEEPMVTPPITPPPFVPPVEEILPPPSPEYQSTESVVVASEEELPIVVPTPKVEPIKPPDWNAPFKGVYENWRYKGDGPLRQKEEIVYRGGWKDGERYGENCECHFRDPHGNAWTYQGGFYQDEFAGPGELTLRAPGIEAPAFGTYCVKHFRGTFNLPKEKEAARSNSLSHNELPAVAPRKVKDVLKHKEPAVKFIDDAASSNATLYVLDDREALSLGGDDTALALPLGKLANDFHKNIAKLGSVSSLSSGDETLGDGQQATRRYMPRQLAWTRKLDPNLGYQGLAARFGVGLVEYTNDCTFDKKDGTGLYHEMPHGGGIFKCPICPLEYTGYMYRGRPEGRGHIIFRPQPGRINSPWLPTVTQEYKGEWKDGKRHGYGVLTALGGCLIAKGEWKEDLLDGEHCSIEISGALLENPAIRMKSYYGACKAGRPEGRGDMKFKRIKPLEAPTDVKDYVEYRGYFKNGVRDGPMAAMLDERGEEIYRGGFENDAAHGRVVRYRLPKEGMYTGREVYVGNIVKGELAGLGVLYNGDTKQVLYDGMWNQNVPGGDGIRVLESGDHYEGQFVSGKPHGKGVLKCADGRTYEGPWFKAQPHGLGRYEEGGLTRLLEFSNGKHMQKKGGMCAGDKVADDSIPPFPHLDLGGHNYQYWNATCKVNPNWIPQLLQEVCGCWRYHERHPEEALTELQKLPKPAELVREVPKAPATEMRPLPEVRITVLDGTVFPSKKNSPLVVCVLWEPRNAATTAAHTDETGKATWSEVKQFTHSVVRENIGFVVMEKDTSGRPLAFAIYNIMAFLIKHANDTTAVETSALKLDGVDGADAGILNVRIELRIRDPNDVPPRNEDVKLAYNDFPESFRNAVSKLADATIQL